MEKLEREESTWEGGFRAENGKVYQFVDQKKRLLFRDTKQTWRCVVATAFHPATGDHALNKPTHFAMPGEVWKWCGEWKKLKEVPRWAVVEEPRFLTRHMAHEGSRGWWETFKHTTRPLSDLSI